MWFINMLYVDVVCLKVKEIIMVLFIYNVFFKIFISLYYSKIL